MKRMLLINPREAAPQWPTMPRAVEPMGLLYTAAAFRQAGVEVDLLDLQLGYGDEETAFEAAGLGHYDDVGIALGSQSCLWSALAIAQDVKNRSPHTLVFTGGVFASLNAGWLLDTCEALDFVVVGESEPFVSDWADSRWQWQGLPSVQQRTPGQPAPRLPVSPLARPGVLPDRSLTATVMERGEHPSVVATRGCGANCSFCCIARYHGSGWKKREVQDVCAELRSLAERFGARRYHLIDDNLFGHTGGARAWAEQLAGMMRGFDPPLWFKATCRMDDLDASIVPVLKEAGIELLKIGVETFGKDAQRAYGKVISRDEAAAKLNLLRSAGIGVSLGFIMFDPYSSARDLRTNLDFLLEFDHAWSRHLLRSRLCAYRGARIETLLERDSLAISRGILGTEWRFRDPEAALCCERFDGLLRTHVLPLETDFANCIKWLMQRGIRPPRTDIVAARLKSLWVELFRLALDGRAPRIDFGKPLGAAGDAVREYRNEARAAAGMRAAGDTSFTSGLKRQADSGERRRML